MKNELLLIPDKPDIERDALAKAWEEQGGEVQRVAKFWIKPEVGDKRVSIYGYDSFCLVLAQILGVELLMPKDEIIANLSHIWIKREIEIIAIKDLEHIAYPKFIKPVIPKLFAASVFNSAADLKLKIQEIEETALLICSDIVEVQQEVRSFILNKTIQDIAFYEGEGNIEQARQFVTDFLKNTKTTLPGTFVLDIGFNDKLGWFVIEFNSSWGAGLNGCRADRVVVCVQAAAKK